MRKHGHITGRGRGVLVGMSAFVGAAIAVNYLPLPLGSRVLVGMAVGVVAGLLVNALAARRSA
jgi:nitrogen fixation protein FixH